MKPLAYTMRPKNFDEIVGQNHLVGPKGTIKGRNEEPQG